MIFEGDDALFGGSGNDFLDGWTGIDDGDGGADNDTCFNLDTQVNCEPIRTKGECTKQQRIWNFPKEYCQGF